MNPWLLIQQPPIMDTVIQVCYSFFYYSVHGSCPMTPMMTFISYTISMLTGSYDMENQGYYVGGSTGMEVQYPVSPFIYVTISHDQYG